MAASSTLQITELGPCALVSDRRYSTTQSIHCSPDYVSNKYVVSWCRTTLVRAVRRGLILALCS